ncbi:MAG: glycosyl hydrolase 115 family protein [Opitutaceae bacterium]|nr:glycosyl hydrolase 115 family protein [Opitutaceae bacterium]
MGTIGQSTLIDGLIAQGKLDTGRIRGRWEAFMLVEISEPFPGMPHALIIAGSDRRGTIYGIYELSYAMGVSPWYWWADVPVQRQAAVFVSARPWIDPGPSVKYRGIFLNDEAPALTGWAREKYGGLNSRFYAKVFELLLRLRGNYLWPAMWGNAFNEDDPESPRLADAYGIVMGTSHHEPMLRAQQEWRRHGSGPWNYITNGAALRQFWADGLRRNRNYESIITVGMRGDGDLAMSEETNVELLEQIVADQRGIIRETFARAEDEVPQSWALYKEVQAYYEHGMKVPDDVTLLWCDDNWGNLRRLPTATERKRSGGAGVYYHFDYVGDPRNYKWLNTIPISKIWEQMHLAWQYGADRIWIANVGDLKPMEFPIEFFLRYAWRPEEVEQAGLEAHSRDWAGRQFGASHAEEIAALINGYTKLNSLRKPEMLSPDTFSLVNYREAERVLGEWRGLEDSASRIARGLPAESGPAFFQLVQHPIVACRIVTELNLVAGRNRLFATQGRATTNSLADKARALFANDAAQKQRWDALLDGKWRRMMDQTHLGYVTWQQPVRNAMPAVTELQVPEVGELAIAVEGDPAARPGDYPVPETARLPALSPYGPRSRWFDVFNRGKSTIGFRIETSHTWLQASVQSGELGPDLRVEVGADWDKAPSGITEGRIIVRSATGAPPLTIIVPVDKRPVPVGSFVESDGYIAIEAPNFHRAVAGDGIEWKTLPEFGRSLGGVTTFPVLEAASTPGGDSPHLAYAVFLHSAGEVTVELQCAPSLDFTPGEALRFAVSFDDASPQVLRPGTAVGSGAWETAVGEGAVKVRVRLTIDRPGVHELKFWRVTPGVVLERIVIDTGGVRASYLGPPESGQRGRGTN